MSKEHTYNVTQASKLIGRSPDRIIEMCKRKVFKTAYQPYPGAHWEIDKWEVDLMARTEERQRRRSEGLRRSQTPQAPRKNN